VAGVCGLQANTTIFSALSYDPVTNPNSLCTATNTCWDLFGYGVVTSATSVAFKNDSIQGTIGIGAGTAVTTTGSGGSYAVLNGPIDYSDAGTQNVTVYTDGTHTATTSVVVPSSWSFAARTEIDTAPYTDSSASATIASATTDYLTMANYWANQTTYTVNQLNTSNATKLGVAGGVTSIDITGQGVVYYTFGSNVNTNLPITITGGPNDIIIFEVPNNRTVTLNAAITLQGGMTPDNVLWNITNTATTNVLNINAGDQEIEGDFIVAGKYTITNALIYGRVFGGAGAVAWNGDGNETTVPEPATWSLTAAALAAAALLRRTLR
jgi:hypothetical protein